MPRYAALDVGTNSVKITVADVGGGYLTDILYEQSEVTRLGRGVDKTRRFEDASVEATLRAVAEFVVEARRQGADRIVAGGTSAMRDAENGDEFRRRAAEIIGGDVEVIAGAREAELAFLGAMSDPQLAGSAARVLAFDAGGGSTELIVGAGKPPKIDEAQSLDVGAVRLTERHLHSDPPSPDEINAAWSEANRLISAFQPGGAAVERIVGIGGTVVNAASMLRATTHPAATEEQIDVQGSTVAADDLRGLTDRLAALTVERRRQVPGLEPARADVIVAGLLIIREVLARFEQPELIVSTRGVRHGLLLELA